MARLEIEELEGMVVDMTQADINLLSEIYDALELDKNKKPRGFKRLKDAILAKLATMPATDISPWQKPSESTANLIAEIRRLRSQIVPINVDEVARKVLDLIVANRGQIGLVDPITLEALTTEVLNQVSAQTTPAITEEKLRAIIKEATNEKPLVVNSDPEPMPDPNVDLAKWITWAEKQPSNIVPKVLIDAAKASLPTKTKNDDNRVIRTIKAFFNMLNSQPLK